MYFNKYESYVTGMTFFLHPSHGVLVFTSLPKT